jgi:hypothetical protein
VLRRAINDRYSEGADLGNYGIALLQRGRGAEALPYLQRARAVFVELGMAHLVAQMDQLIATARAKRRNLIDAWRTWLRTWTNRLPWRRVDNS